jgi:hypothetical protein
MAACVDFAAEILQSRTECLSDELAGIGLLESEKIRAMEELAYLGQLAIEIGGVSLHGLTVCGQDKASEGLWWSPILGQLWTKKRALDESVSGLRILGSSTALRW